MTDTVQTTEVPEAHSQVEASTERMVPQSKVDNIVHGIKAEAREKLERERAAWEQQLAMQSQVDSSTTPSAAPELSEVEAEALLKAYIEEETTAAVQKAKEQEEKQRTDAQSKADAEKLEKKLLEEMYAAAPEYENYETVVGRLNSAKLSGLIKEVGSLSDCGHLLYHLGENPTMVANLNNLLDLNPALARVELQNLASKVSKTRNVKSKKVAEPLSPISASSLGTSNGLPDIRDIKAKYTY